MSNERLRAALGDAPAPQSAPKILEYLNNPRVQKGLAAVAGKYLAPERMLRLCVNAVKRTPLLAHCDPQSVLGAMMSAAALGLEPNTPQQSCFLIPYKRRVKVGDVWTVIYECQFQIGARGFVNLAYRSPQIRMMVADAPHEHDLFEHEIGSNTFLRYRKTLGGLRGGLLGAFSYVRFESNAESVCLLPLDEVYKIRARSEAWRNAMREVENATSDAERARAQAKLDETPWMAWTDDMASKSALKKHAKQLPLAGTDAMTTAASLDDASETGTIDLAAMADPDVARAVVEDDSPVPVIANNPSATLDVEPDAREPVETPAPPPPVTRARRMTPTPPAPAPMPTTAPPPEDRRSYAQVVAAIEGARDAEAAVLELDLARTTFSPEQCDALALVYRNRWEAST